MLVRMDKSTIQLKNTNIINLISFLMPGASQGSLLAFSLPGPGTQTNDPLRTTLKL